MSKLIKATYLLIFMIALIGCSVGEKVEGEASENKSETEELQAGGELKVAYPAQPQMLDPQMSGAIATTDIMWHVYEPLLGVNENYEIEPMLADTFEQSEDGKTIIFNLRKGVLFHNGKEMLAEDVVASMNRWKVVSTFGQMQFENATFEVKDDYTVVLTLPEPMSTALYAMAYPSAGFAAIMPKEIIEAAGDVNVKEFIGTGPFQFVEWKQDQYVLLERFDDYQAVSNPPSMIVGEKKALVDELYFVFTPDSSTQVSGLESGEYDIAHEVHRDSAERLVNDPNITNYVYPDAYLVANFNKKKGFFTDVNARLAVSAALDMEAILKAAFTSDEYYKLNHSNMMYHQLELWNSDAGKELYNIADTERAKALLDQAGYNDETITIITDREYEEHYNASVVIQEQLQQLGMKVDLEVYDWATILDKIYEEDAYDMYVMGLTPNPEPTGARYLGSEYAGWTNSPELEPILSDFRSKPNLEAAKEVYDQLQQWYWDYMPAIRVGDYDAIVSVRNTVQGYGDQNKQHRPIYWNVANNK